MPHHRTSSLFSAVVGAAATAGTRLAATAAAVSLVSAAAPALAGPAAAAAPIPLPHHWSGAGLVGAGHHAAGPRTPGGPSLPAGYRPAADLAGGDHLTVTVHHSGSARTDGTFELYCHPGGGNHPHVKAACTKLDGMARWGRDPFAPVPQGANCTMMYGGPATAHVTGTWAGRPVNADFRRTNGCEIGRWGHFEPLLPSTRS
ncbi:subtilase-type protease inhibitor [Streptomyces sp. NBC_01456]|uniref:SSI family serine proteinase inhibitor n=1 Tax=unclassified Streptomyces TaxID=2593676 RepID=UPI002E374AFB|nr:MULTISPECIES: SSI family serine proteinase inhibitor [unclassified Streptomyces]